MQIGPPLEPVLLHHLHRLLNRHLTPLLPLETLKLLQYAQFVLFEVKSMDVPGLPVLDVAEIKRREKLHGLLYLRADIVGRFHYFPE